MPLYVADYLADTRRLSTLEHGAYLLLIMDYWTTGGLPTDERKLARIAGLSDKEWARVRPAVSEFFDGDWKHKRVDAELAKAAEKSAAARANGSRGARSKWGVASDAQAKRSERLAAARANGRHTKEEWAAMLRAMPLCVKCGADEHIVKDHIVPIYQGGSDAIENIQPLCHSCNSSKGPDTTDLRPVDWRDRMSGEMSGERVANASHRAGVPQPQPHISDLRSEKRAIDHEFETVFWPAWPNKVGKPAALKAFHSVRKAGCALDAICFGLTIYVRDKPPDRPWLNPATFLNQRRFEDRPAAVAAPRAGPGRQTERTTILSSLFTDPHDDEPPADPHGASAGHDNGSGDADPQDRGHDRGFEFGDGAFGRRQTLGDPGVEIFPPRRAWSA